MDTSTTPNSNLNPAQEGTDRKFPREGVYVKQVGSTHPREGENANEYASAPTFNTQVRHFRLAFAIVGSMVANGFIKVDFDHKDWHLDFEVAVLDTAAVLNQYNY